MKSPEPIDVICQHCRDGSIIPIKIRVQDEEQIFHTYVIKSYIPISKDKVLLPNEVFVTNDILRYDCKIEVFGVVKKIRLHYDKSKVMWFIYY